MIRNLIFDMGGVILPMRPIEEPIRRFARIGLPEGMAMSMFGLHGQQGIFQDVESGSLSAEAFLREYHRLTGYGATFTDIEWAWQGFVHDPPPERLRWLRELREEGYHLALLSNTNPFLNHHMESPAFSPEGLPMSSYFHSVYLSYRLHACKPSPLAFRRMLTLGGYPPEECLFLDDALPNVLAARALGIHALHVPDNHDWLLPLRQAVASPLP